MRRRGLQWAVRFFALTWLFVLVWGFVVEPGRLVERNHVLPLRRWPQSCDGLRLDVISDTHTGSPRNGVDKLDRLVQRLVASDSQAVLMTGDYVILSVLLGTYITPEVIAAHLRPLTARKPVYAVLGNHDWWKDGERVRRALESVGVVMLDNRAQAATFGGCRVWLAGIGDLLEGKPDIARAFSMVTDAAPVVVLTHEPELLPRIPLRAALTIAGHTHGGQIDPWPYRRDPAGFMTGSRRLKWHIQDRGRILFVSPGVGTSILPMRLGVPPEISRLTLRANSAKP